MLFLYMVRGFAMPVLVGAIFTGLTYPIYRKVLKMIKNRVLSSILTLVFIIVVIFLPLSIIGFFDPPNPSVEPL